MFGKIGRDALAAILMLAAAGRGASAGPIAYLVDSSNNLGTVDLATGAFSQIGVVQTALEANGRQTKLFAMGFGADGKLYGVDNRVGHLYRIDPTTAATTDLGATGSRAVGGGSGPGNTLYFLSFFAPSDLNRIDLPGPTSSVVGSIGFEGDGSLAYDGQGSFYATGIETGLLHRIDAATGASVEVGPHGLPSASQGVGASVFVGGVLYGFTGNKEIVTIDVATGAATIVADIQAPGDFIGAAAAPWAAPVPEPAGVVSLAVGLAAIGLAGRASLSRPAVRRPDSGG